MTTLALPAGNDNAGILDVKLSSTTAPFVDIARSLLYLSDTPLTLGSTNMRLYYSTNDLFRTSVEIFFEVSRKWIDVTWSIPNHIVTQSSTNSDPGDLSMKTSNYDDQEHYTSLKSRR